MYAAQGLVILSSSAQCYHLGSYVSCPRHVYCCLTLGISIPIFHTSPNVIHDPGKDRHLSTYFACGTKSDMHDQRPSTRLVPFKIWVIMLPAFVPFIPVVRTHTGDVGDPNSIPPFVWWRENIWTWARKRECKFLCTLEVGDPGSTPPTPLTL